MTIAAVIFDLDGVLLDSEPVWNEARETLTRDSGGRWSPEAVRDMMGMSSPEWSRYMHDELGVPLAPEEISRDVVARVRERYGAGLPLIEGAVDAVRALAAHWPLGLASSANREIIDLALGLSGLAALFATSVSSEEVAAGKPAPDVYLEAASRLAVSPAAAAAVEDSTNGLLSARAAGMAVIAVPNRDYPPAPEALAAADLVLGSLRELTPAAVERVEHGAAV